MIFVDGIVKGWNKRISEIMSEARHSINAQLAQLHNRYTGTGHADMTKFEWLSHQHRDTTTSIVGHSPLLMFTAIADNQSTQRMKFELTQRMLQPCGPPPPKEDD